MLTPLDGGGPAGGDGGEGGDGTVVVVGESSLVVASLVGSDSTRCSACRATDRLVVGSPMLTSADGCEQAAPARASPAINPAVRRAGLRRPITAAAYRLPSSRPETGPTWFVPAP